MDEDEKRIAELIRWNLAHDLGGDVEVREEAESVLFVFSWDGNVRYAKRLSKEWLKSETSGGYGLMLLGSTPNIPASELLMSESSLIDADAIARGLEPVVAPSYPHCDGSEGRYGNHPHERMLWSIGLKRYCCLECGYTLQRQPAPGDGGEGVG